MHMNLFTKINSACTQMPGAKTYRTLSVRTHAAQHWPCGHSQGTRATRGFERAGEGRGPGAGRRVHTGLSLSPLPGAELKLHSAP